MNFKTLTLLGTVLCAFGSQTAEAKFAPKTLQPHSETLKKPNLIELAQHAKKQFQQQVDEKRNPGLKTAKTTATKSRVVAYSFRDLSIPQLTDTTKLYYGSPNRGSDLAKQILKYDSLVNYTYEPSVSSFIKVDFSGQTFDALDNILTTTDKIWNDGTSTYENDTRTAYVYNAANKVVSSITETWDGTAWVNDSKTISKYDAAQNKIADSIFSWAAGTWENSYVETNSYTSSNKIASTAYHIYETTLGIWLNVASISNTYDASDYLTSSLLKVINSTTFTLENNARYTFTNDAVGNPLVSLQESWDDVSSTWIKDARVYSTFDAAKNKTSEINTTWNDIDGKYDTLTLLSNSYNSYNQIKTEVNSNWDASTSAWVKADSTTYYYEEHTPTSIIEIANNSRSKAYPIPAQNELTVSANIAEVQNILMLISDIQGRVLTEIKQNNTADFNQKISVSNIPSGNYILSIQGDKGFKSAQKITIAH